jgi:hypothetical protein
MERNSTSFRYGAWFPQERSVNGIERSNPTFTKFHPQEYHTMTETSDLKNFAVFTVDISSVEQKTGRSGNIYAIGRGSLPMPKGEAMPLRIVALDPFAGTLSSGTSTLIGRLGYDEKDGQGTLQFFPTRIEPAPKDGRYRNYVYLSLRVGQDGDCRYSAAGHFWGRVRMALGQGKDGRGKYRPSLWLTVKGFTSRDGDETVPRLLAGLHKGDQVSVTGRLIYEISPTSGKGYFHLLANKVDIPPVSESQAIAEQDCPY